MDVRKPSNAAVQYVTDEFSMNRSDVMGRHSASLGILSGMARYLESDPLYCYTARRASAATFAASVAAAAGRERPVRMIAYGEERRLAEPGCLFRSDPAIGMLAWHRRAIDQRAYSLCGLTHSLSSKAVMDSIGNFLLAPLQPWDAVICTSRAARHAIEGVIEQWSDYLQQRVGATPVSALRLPVIPLGVDCDRFTRDEAAERKGGGLRDELGIADHDVALLYFGRMSFHGKAHPVSMFRAAEIAASRTTRRLHFVLCGQFSNDSLRNAFETAARAYSPSVRIHFIDGADQVRSHAVWFAADIFLSLSDNIQETFGLTPIEAQAAGLPVVVSDWDGYKDTVVDGETGFRVPTLVPWPGPGERLMMMHASDALSYDRFIGGASLMTVVDADRAADALVRLADDADLRRGMGDAGRRRALSHYDWSVVIAAYTELWAELAEIRASAGEVAPPRPGRPRAPLRDDPFRVFSGFATEMLSADHRVEAVAGAEELDAARSLAMNNFLEGFLLPGDGLHSLLRAADGSVSVTDLVSMMPGVAPNRVTASLLWLAKLGLVRLTAPD